MTNDLDLISPKRLLIEEWLPMRELGIESRRERAAASALPPLSFLHVWWARRPLVASAGVVLAGLLPAWSPQLSEEFPDAPQLANVEAYRKWLMHLCGIWGDPISARAAYDQAVQDGVRIPNPYSYRQAFRNHPDRENIDLLHQVLERTWGVLPAVVDPTAGGGSIPFTAARMGLPSYANDLNGVASSILRAGVKIPAEHGTSLIPHLKQWGEVLVNRVKHRLAPYFPSGPNERVITYYFAHSVACPRTGRIVPLVTDWWLRKEKGKEAAVRLVHRLGGVELPEPRFEVVHGSSIDFDPAKGVASRGSAVSPYDDLVISGEYIKAEAQAGRMTQVLYAVAFRRPDGKRDFRAPTEADLAALASSAEELERLRPEWEMQGVLPTEKIDTVSNYERGHRLYGMDTWADMFTERQLLTHATFADEFNNLVPEVQGALGRETATEVLAQLALMQGTALNYNARSSSWHVNRQAMRSVFDKHNFAFKWTFAEFEGSQALYPWCLYQLTDAYEKLARLFENTGLQIGRGEPLDRSVTVTQGNGADLRHLGDQSIAHVCMDPPYYDNVMYAELADFFYVWEKRTLGRVLPEYFSDELTDKDNEAVANPARFAAFGRKKNQLADADYEAKMTAVFAECHRVLRSDGVLTVMFTHKRAEAWDTLGMALLEAGFTIEASWPVNTESENSLHQANVNSAASTIMLVCRKRRTTDATAQVFFEDVESEVRQAARDALVRFERSGLSGVDLLLSTYGPAMSVISGYWPVNSSQASDDGSVRLLRPEEALSTARNEVSLLQLNRIVGHAAQFEPYTDFTLLAWHTFHTSEFGFDDARRLALSTGGLDVDQLVRAKIIEKKAGTVRLRDPKDRVTRRSSADKAGVDPGAEQFDHPIDAVHTACYIADMDGLTAAKAFLDRTGLTKDRGFRDCFQGLVNAVPRARVKGDWVVPLAGTLDRLATAYLPDVVLPELPAERRAFVQGDLYSEAG
jgi:adenine-specific DNA methylase